MCVHIHTTCPTSQHPRSSNHTYVVSLFSYTFSQPQTYKISLNKKHAHTCLPNTHIHVPASTHHVTDISDSTYVCAVQVRSHPTQGITLCYTILQMCQKLHFPFSHTYTHTHTHNTDTRRHHTLNYVFLSQPIYHNPHLTHVCCAQT